MQKQNIKIALIQTNASNNQKLNLQKTILHIKKAAQKGAKVICLQELFQTKYFPRKQKGRVSQLAEFIPGKSTTLLAKIAKELKIVIIAPIFEIDSITKKYYNSAAVIDADGAILGTYRKTHIPHDPFFYEKNYFKPSDINYRVFKTRYLNLGVLICYDQWFSEAARILALQGADIIFYPTAIGYIKGDQLSQSDWIQAWKTIQRSHAIANGIYTAAVNRVGQEGKINFWGLSFVCDAFGKIIAQANQKENILLTYIDIKKSREIQKDWGFIRNRRPETYGLINQPLQNNPPKKLGFYMPAEWEGHQSTYLSWPYDPITFPERVKKVENAYIKIIQALHQNENINLFVKDNRAKQKVEKLLRQKNINLKKINFYVWNYSDIWFRDYGPIFIINRDKNKIALTHWLFNSWGSKYLDLMRDSQIPQIINQKLQLPYFRPEITLEGGSIDVNGKGAVLTTEQCLLNHNRNPNLSKRGIEQYLKNYLGISHVIWLKNGIAGDDTDGHIDNLARFVNPRTVLCAHTDDKKNINYAPLEQNYQTLLKSVDQNNRKLKIIKMLIPSPIKKHTREETTYLPASYLNFYIANKIVLAPLYRDKNDAAALKILKDVFPNRKIVGINCVDLIYGLGSIHCITQQQPA